MTAKRPFRILIDARHTMGGVERYTFELSRLVQSSCNRDSIDLFGRDSAIQYKAAQSPKGVRRLLRTTLGSCRRIVTDQLLLPLAARRAKADLIHSTNYLVPPCTGKPVVVTCHDLSLLDHFSTKQAGPMRHYERTVLQIGLQRAAHIIAPSIAVATELRQRFEFDRDRISAIYPPLPSFCFKAPTEITKAMPGKLDLHQPFFLSVGTIEPRKNLHRLLAAWKRVYTQCRIPLIIVGPSGWGESRLLTEQLRATDGLHWLGCIDDSSLAGLYRQATAVVQYSLAEGFDYPVAEAICSDTPVVLSDIEVHREVAADCGLFAPPTDPETLAGLLLEVSTWSDDQRRLYSLKARRQADLLRKASSIERYISLYKEVLAEKYTTEKQSD